MAVRCPRTLFYPQLIRRSGEREKSISGVGPRNYTICEVVIVLTDR